uniref:Putative secreted protein n=1 Tax=Anopheles darlingi TaxID=43151 RepID=A0A2M4DLX5_ANODA
MKHRRPRRCLRVSLCAGRFPWLGFAAMWRLNTGDETLINGCQLTEASACLTKEEEEEEHELSLVGDEH